MGTRQSRFLKSDLELPSERPKLLNTVRSFFWILFSIVMQFFSRKNFKCPKCNKSMEKRKNVAITECSHYSCIHCLIDHCLKSSEKYIDVRCPAKNCQVSINEGSIQRLLANSYVIYYQNVQSLRRHYGFEDKNAATPVLFKCMKCLRSTLKCDGFQVKRCLHSFCKQCLTSHCNYSSTKYVEVRCPEKNCQNMVTDAEVKELLGDGYKDYSSKVESFCRAKVLNCSKCDSKTKQHESFRTNLCSHTFCRRCFIYHCMYSSQRYAKLRCPVKSCKNIVDDDEIQNILGDDYGTYSRNVVLRAAKKDDCGGAEGAQFQNPNLKCLKCTKEVMIIDAIKIKRCSHGFCKNCLASHCTSSSNRYVEVRCPAKNCRNTMDEDEIEELLGNSYEEYSRKVTQRLFGKAMPRRPNAKEPKQESSVANKKHENLLSFAGNEQQPEENFFEPCTLATSYEQVEKKIADDIDDYIENFEAFSCQICFIDAEIGEGVILKKCQHKFCKECLIATVQHSEGFEVKCPNNDPLKGNCTELFTEREIRRLVPKNVFEKQLEKSLKLFEGTHARVIKHCKTPDCAGFVELERKISFFWCPACRAKNCLRCGAIHEGKCSEKANRNVNNTDVRSKKAIQDMVKNNSIMECPKCGVFIEKSEGCDYIICPSCKLKLCWVTKKPRHPLTLLNGEVIDGCHCRENGKRCHKDCQNCH